MMRRALLSIAAVALMLSNAGMARAIVLYSFEAPPVNPDGFGPNGGGVTVSQDVVGVTDGLSSLKVSVVQGATFVGALSGIVHPAVGDPPGIDKVYVDLTVAPGQEFPGNFAVVGVTIFGAGLTNL